MRNSYVALLTLLAFVFLAFSNPAGDDGSRTSSKDTRLTNKSHAKIKWMSLEQALAAHQNSPKKIFVDIYTDWCVICKQLEKATLNNPMVANYINSNFYPVKFDAETNKTIDYNGKTYNFLPNEGRNGIHELALYLTRGRISYPSVTFVDEALTNPQPVQGFQNPERMAKLAHYFGEDYYQNIDWPIFDKVFQVENK